MNGYESRLRIGGDLNLLGTLSVHFTSPPLDNTVHPLLASELRTGQFDVINVTGLAPDQSFELIDSSPTKLELGITSLMPAELVPAVDAALEELSAEDWKFT